MSPYLPMLHTRLNDSAMNWMMCPNDAVYRFALRPLVHILCDVTSIGSGLTTECQAEKIQQCKTYAAEYQILGKDQKISARRSIGLLGISRSWTTLAHQLENLTAIVNEEGK
jgi:hypothetical protein